MGWNPLTGTMVVHRDHPFGSEKVRFVSPSGSDGALRGRTAIAPAPSGIRGRPCTRGRPRKMGRWRPRDLLDGGVSSVGWIAGRYGLTVLITRCVGAMIRSLFFTCPMPMQKRTCEIGVHVRGNAIRTCTSPTSHVVVRLSVAPRPPGWLCRAGTGGRGRSDPPFSMPCVASGRVGMCTPSHLPRGSLRTSNPLREGPSANRNEHVGISRPGPQPRAGGTLASGGERCYTASRRP